MPSIRSISNLILSTATLVQSALSLTSPVHRHAGGSLAASATCPQPQLSCHNTTAVKNLCCFNAPGGSLLQTQFWDTAPVAGPSDSWTIHGLWPDNCDGTYAANCDASRAYTNITAILRSSGHSSLLSYMQKFWVSNDGSAESFWEHEWAKHGTCISTLDPNCYTDYQPTEEVPDFFMRTVSLFKSLPTYDWLNEAGVVPSTTKTYQRSQIQAALSGKHGANVYLGCTGGTLSEVWYYFNVRGSVQTGQFIPAGPVGVSQTCPATGIKYPPKGSSGGGSSPTTTTTSTGSSPTSAGPSPTSTGTAFHGSGYLNVVTSGSKQGCIISYGTWYIGGTCATISAIPVPSGGFQLRSSKGNCGISAGKLLCGADVKEATTFQAEGSSLVYEGSTNFYADAVPSGSEQGTVFASKGANAVSLGLEWQGV